MLGPSDTARVIVVDPEPTRSAARVGQLSWRGFAVSAGRAGDLGAAHGAVVVVDAPDDLQAALSAARQGVVVVVCAALDAAGLQRALHAGVTAWVAPDAPVADITEHLYRGLDAVRECTLGEAAKAAVQELPLPAIVSDVAGRVLVASRQVPDAHPGLDAHALVGDAGWRGRSLAQGARLHLVPGVGAGGADEASIKLAQVAAFAGEAQHEINNFATYVLANLGALMDDDWAVPPSREDQLDMTREAHDGARGMVDVVRRLRVAVQAEAAPRKVPVDLADRTRSVAARLGPPVVLDAPPELLVQADPARLERALQALMAAARQHGEGDKVRVQVAVDNGAAVVRISGGGPGFDRVQGRKLFASFLKEPGRMGPPPESLSLVTAIASEHGGSASVREHPDGRRWFVMELPLDESVPL